ncbi:hypothetical protein [Helicobacter bilis]|uniref:Uncharacterized protein n=1 Tax=Helicobacter bilis TaxID=37372 RepID=A0A6D2C4X4_9HELI|nr:hypothetical protein [Helicobacter bilis]TLE04055.1 hypothetical protein LS77_007040 [Helicobacter bilis]TLE04351.1 hypothetical protein LS76_008515 [Helicobacter bilis]
MSENLVYFSKECKQPSNKYARNRVIKAYLMGKSTKNTKEPTQNLEYRNCGRRSLVPQIQVRYSSSLHIA